LLLRVRRREYIMGAGTVKAEHAEAWIRDMGLVFGAAYAIYDVRSVDGHRLVQASIDREMPRRAASGCNIITTAFRHTTEVITTDRLVQLRNPPGDHDEWRGDWSDDSPLWSARLKRKLGHADVADDNTFWMAFDDFCSVFRCLYVCHYYQVRITFHSTMRRRAHGLAPFT
jgi:hypothetical protein